MSVIRIDIDESHHKEDGGELILKFSPKRILITTGYWDDDLSGALDEKDIDLALLFLNKCKDALKLRQDFYELDKSTVNYD